MRDTHRYHVALALVGCLGIMLLGLAVVGTMAEARGTDLNIDAEVSTLLATIGGAIVGGVTTYLGGSSRPPAVSPDPAAPAVPTDPVAPAPTSATEAAGFDDTAYDEVTFAEVDRG